VYTIVADADGLIKLGKSGALPALLLAARVLVPQAVWEEAVEEGKRGMHEDAHILERVLLSESGGAEIVDAEGVDAEGAEKVQGDAPPDIAASFGAGEAAALAAFHRYVADAVLTDDRAFLGLLAGSDPPVPALVPTAAVVGLAEGGHLTLGEARETLCKLRPSVREGAFGAAMEELEEMERAKERKR